MLDASVDGPGVVHRRGVPPHAAQHMSRLTQRHRRVAAATLEMAVKFTSMSPPHSNTKKLGQQSTRDNEAAGLPLVT
jgi:hypothetical protein